jgi:hypothetical protein
MTAAVPESMISYRYVECNVQAFESLKSHCLPKDERVSVCHEHLCDGHDEHPYDRACRS